MRIFERILKDNQLKSSCYGTIAAWMDAVITGIDPKQLVQTEADVALMEAILKGILDTGKPPAMATDN